MFVIKVWMFHYKFSIRLVDNFFRRFSPFSVPAERAFLCFFISYQGFFFIINSFSLVCSTENCKENCKPSSTSSKLESLNFPLICSFFRFSSVTTILTLNHFSNFLKALSTEMSLNKMILLKFLTFRSKTNENANDILDIFDLLVQKQ